MNDELEEAVSRYLERCFSKDDRAQIERLVKDKEYDELQRRMLPRIAFGTSGLRAKLEAGYSRINDLTVYEASIGLRNYVLQNVPDAATRGVVIGHDHRHHSAEFAAITQAVFAKSMKVYQFGQNVFTPLVVCP